MREETLENTIEKENAIGSIVVGIKPTWITIWKIVLDAIIIAW